MPFITFDYKCTGCGKLFPDKLVLRKDMDAQRCECGSILKRYLAAPITTFRFSDPLVFRKRNR